MNQPSYWKVLFLTVLAFTAMACITINVYFPEAAVRDLSEKIEDAVTAEAARLGEEAPAAEDPGTAGQGGGESAGAGTAPDGGPTLARAAGRLAGWLLDATAADAHAQTVAAPEISNPAIRKIVDSRARRVAELGRYKASGVLGENNQALVEIRDLESLPLRERARVQQVVREENEDRRRMFREIAAATDADLSQLGRIQSTYAETLRANAARGEWIQLPDGRWQRKG